MVILEVKLDFFTEVCYNDGIGLLQAWSVAVLSTFWLS